MNAEQDAIVAARYLRFAMDEAPGRSELYEQWAAGVASDAGVQQVIARIRPDRRQPALVFAVTRMLGVGDLGFDQWREWVLAHADQVVFECERRAVQTNEPLRCAALLPALSLVSGPIALLEVGASAGLCLYPDRYSYEYRSDTGATRRLDPADGPSEVLLSCDVRGDIPAMALPDVVWRVGIDLQPLDPRSPSTKDWLTGLVWPGETGRAKRIGDALAIAADDPPELIAGDAVEILSEVAARAPHGATLVVTTPGVLAHLPRTARHRVIEDARLAGKWITIDDPGLHDGWDSPIDTATWPGGFAVALDGKVLAAADPLGGWLEWLPGRGAVAR